MRTKVYRWCGIAATVMLVGCVGIKPGESPSTQFTVPLTLKETYARAMVQTDYCLVTDDKFPVVADMSADGQTAQIKVLFDFRSAVVAQIDMVAKAPQSTQVDVVMWGVNVWDNSAVQAMKAAIEFGVPSCINYFPNAQPIEKKQ